MNIKKISQAIDEYLKKTIDYNKILPEEVILLRNGITPLVISDRESSYLGSGESAYAFDVLYNGKNCVAKVTNNFKNVESLLALFRLKNSLGDLGKHIAEIYSIKEYNNEVINGELYSGFIILMEKLEPLDPSVSRFLFGSNYFSGYDLSFKNFKDSFILTLNLYKNPYVYFEEMQNLFINFNVNISNKDIYEICKEFSNIFIKHIEYSFEQLQKTFDENKRIYSSKILDEIRKNINNNINEYLLLFNKYLINKNILIEFILNFADLFLKKLTNGFSTSFEEAVAFGDFSKYQNISELKSIIKLLKILKNKFNIEFKDLHSDNIMQRPNSKEIVISDAGYFKI